MLIRVSGGPNVTQVRWHVPSSSFSVAGDKVHGHACQALGEDDSQVVPGGGEEERAVVTHGKHLSSHDVSRTEAGQDLNLDSQGALVFAGSVWRCPPKTRSSAHNGVRYPLHGAGSPSRAIFQWTLVLNALLSSF